MNNIALKNTESIILNHSVSCNNCDNWEEMGADEPRHKFTEFTLLARVNNGTGIYRCNECNTEVQSEFLEKDED